MKKETIGTAKTIEEAILKACADLGVDREDENVSVEVLETPSRGFLGIGSSDARVKVVFEEAEATQSSQAEAFLKTVLDILGVEAAVDVAAEEETMKINLTGPDMRLIIGRRGETLDALQYLTSLVVNKGKEVYSRVTLDTENYREKREEALVKLAHKLADKAVKYKRNVALEPMNPYERRIIHAALQEVPGISTYSTGSEPNRKVIVAYGKQSDRERTSRTPETR